MGTQTDLWNHVMKEVKAGHYAGPFSYPLTDYFVQSPIGLVPKTGGKTRLIFHLSYNFGVDSDRKSINYHTPSAQCKVKYNDLDDAVRKCLHIIAQTGT